MRAKRASIEVWKITTTTTAATTATTITTGSAGYSEALIVITAIEIFLFVLLAALCFGIAQRKRHQRKLELSEDYAREAAERKMRRRIMKSERKRRKSIQGSIEASRRSPRKITSRGKEEVEKAFRNFLEVQAETYTKPEELMQTQLETPPIVNSEVEVAVTSHSGYSRTEKPFVSIKKTNILTKPTSATQLGIRDVDATLKSTSEQSRKRKNTLASTKLKPSVSRISLRRQAKKGSIEVDATFPSNSEKSYKPIQKWSAGKQTAKLELHTAEDEDTGVISSSETYQKKPTWKRLQKTP
ncbi:hypothetical protein Aduo_000676 [Ancylostoma duodenale]